MSGATSTSRSALDPSSGRGGRALVTILVIVAATVLVYSNTFDASFQFDDLFAIVDNLSLRDLRRLWPPGHRWLGYLSFALNYRFGGLAVSGYHAVNLLIHACNALVVAWLAAITLRTPALRGAEAGPLVRRYLPLTAGLLFAVHPIATQAVTYVVQRFASLATLFYLLSLALYARGRLSLEAGGRWNARAAALYGASLLAAVCAMETKEISFTLPLAAAAYELQLFRPGRRVLLLLLPLAATALLVPLGLVAPGQDLATALAEPSRLAAEAPDIPRVVYLLTQSRVLVTYLRLLVLPVGQNVDHDFPLSYSPFEPGVLLAVAILAAVAALAVLLARRARQTNRAPGALVSFGVAWFFLTSLVESSIIPIHDVIFEHRVYLPAAGAAIAFGAVLLWAVERVASSSSPTLRVAAALVVTAGPLAVAAHARNDVWKDDVTLWSDAVAKSPAKVRPHGSLADAYRAIGRFDEAIREYREAIRLDPRNAQAHNSLGRTYWDTGRAGEAVREYREALRIDPGLAVAHNNFGMACMASGLPQAGIREFEEAIRLEPTLAVAHGNLATALRASGQLERAELEQREAIRLQGGDVDAR